MRPITIRTMRPQDFAGLEQLQRDCYPTLDAKELMRVEHFQSQYKIFPDGQFVAPDGNRGERIIGQGSGFFTDFDLNNPKHTFLEICAGLYFTNHDPNGDYYYAADISVHPDARGQGIGRLLYRARQDLVVRHNRKGIVGGGLIPGYAEHKHTLTPQQYVDKVVEGELYDGTLSFQLKNGFIVRGLIQDYLEDAASDNWATLIEWVNPDYQP
jgi:ribosomal protein S18 acetylase RimI-like enzyme